MIAERGETGITPTQSVAAYEPATGRQVWYAELPGTNNGGSVVTAGDVVFQPSGMDLFALDAGSGKELFRSSLKRGVRASPLTYQAGGRQYVAMSPPIRCSRSRCRKTERPSAAGPYRMARRCLTILRRTSSVGSGDVSGVGCRRAVARLKAVDDDLGADRNRVLVQAAPHQRVRRAAFDRPGLPLCRCASFTSM